MPVLLPAEEEVSAVRSWAVLAVELVTIVPQVLLCAWIFCRLLPLRQPAWFTVLYTVLLTSVHLLLSRVVPMPLWVKPLLQIVLALGLPCLFTRGSRLVSICLTLIQCTLMILMEVLMVVITRWGTTETGMSYFYSVPAANLLMMRTGYNVLYGMFLVPVYFLWKRRFNSGMEYAAPELLPFLLGQAAMTVLVCAMLLTGTGQSAALYFTTVAAVLLSMLAMGVVVWAYFGNQEWYRLERRRLETAHQADLQRRRQAADNTSAEAAAVRQELRSRLETVMAQLERRETAGLWCWMPLRCSRRAGKPGTATIRWRMPCSGSRPATVRRPESDWSFGSPFPMTSDSPARPSAAFSPTCWTMPCTPAWPCRPGSGGSAARRCAAARI